MRVLMVCGNDYANAAFKTYSAIKEFAKDIDIRLWTLHKLQGRPYYSYDILGARSRVGEAEARQADLIHYIDLDLGPTGFPGLALGKPAVFSLNKSKWYGRSAKAIRNYIAKPMRKHSSHVLTAFTPGMPLPDGALYTPQPIDTRKIHARKSPPKHKKLIVGHTPWSPGQKKGTSRITEAVEKTDGARLRLLHGLTPKQVIEAKRTFDVFIDQAQLGGHGYNTLEAACVGIPTLCYLKTDEHPIINIRRDCKDVPEHLERLKDPEIRKEIGLQTREWVERVHGFKPIGEMWEEIYKGLSK